MRKENNVRPIKGFARAWCFTENTMRPFSLMSNGGSEKPVFACESCGRHTDYLVRF